MKTLTFVLLSALTVLTGISCTKLNDTLNSTLTKSQYAAALGANGTQALLGKAYSDVGTPYTDLSGIFALEEVTTDEALVPTRGSDWDDNGKWRALHQHTYTADQVDIINTQFTNLNTLDFDATNVLAFNPSKSQAAEARFLRALAVYQLLDLFGKFPIRNPGDNLLLAPKVLSGDSAVRYIVDQLDSIMPDLSADNKVSLASQDAAKFLLMRVLLNHGALVNRMAPTFSEADMQRVIELGTQLMKSGRYSYMNNYFDNFNATNSGSTESIFAYPNTSGLTLNNSGVINRWFPTLHYNSFSAFKGAAGWNGFSTVADFYNTFGVNKVAVQTAADTLLDPRIGGRFYKGVTDVSGMRPGLMIGQQYDQHGNKLFDRKGNLLAFQPSISPDLKETGNNLEITGIRVLKYPPDFSGKGYVNYNGSAGNWVVLFRYPEAVLMVAEAKMRSSAADNTAALSLVNELRTARHAPPLEKMSLNNPANPYDPNTLLAERGRELYWESLRRMDLIRFGTYLKPFAYKNTTDDPHYLVFPLPTSAVASNPALTQNAGY